MLGYILINTSAEQTQVEYRKSKYLTNFFKETTINVTQLYFFLFSQHRYELKVKLFGPLKRQALKGQNRIRDQNPFVHI